ncbi:MAG: hypothetical protein LBJ02_04530 [Bifidobacteriaceae bacterium]|nr:hypothetical protein [Bifidobacteriaceae bacterium]
MSSGQATPASASTVMSQMAVPGGHTDSAASARWISEGVGLAWLAAKYTPRVSRLPVRRSRLAWLSGRFLVRMICVWGTPRGVHPPGPFEQFVSFKAEGVGELALTPPKLVIASTWEDFGPAISLAARPSARPAVGHAHSGR